MMDRLKFRAYIKYAEMMCYDVNCFYIDRIKNKITIHFDDHTKTFKFDDVILEQAIGLKDKNGKLIYESDYVKINNNIYKVFWNKTKISLINILNNDIIEMSEQNIMEIVGNEHEKTNFNKV